MTATEALKIIRKNHKGINAHVILATHVYITHTNELTIRKILSEIPEARASAVKNSMGQVCKDAVTLNF